MAADDRPTWEPAHLHRNRLSWGTQSPTSATEDVRCCRYCRLELLSGERSGWCCGPAGSKRALVPALPPMPFLYNNFIHDPRISELSRNLNLIFSFAAMESTISIAPSDAGGPSGNVAIQGRIYHRVRPSHESSGVRWILYDGFNASKAPHNSKDWFADIPPMWINSVRFCLMQFNHFAQQLRRLSFETLPVVHLVLKDSGVDEIAAVMSYSNTSQRELQLRNIVITRNEGTKQKLSTVSRLWEPLVYPLLFPHGTLGWGVPSRDDDGNPDYVSPELATSQMWYYRMRLLHEPRFRIFGRLTNEYIVDMFCRMMETRLQYIRNNQVRIRHEDAALMGQEVVPDTENIYLPSSFLGSQRWCKEQVADALSLAARYGRPTFFVTATCNPNWPEIQERLLPGQHWNDDPILVARVFKQKLASLLRALKTMFPGAGTPLYVVYSIEFQKRGLPHVHILIKFPFDCVQPADIDRVVSAEMPQDPADRVLVETFMLHRHSTDAHGNTVVPKYCRKDPQNNRDCRHHYPQPIQEETQVLPDGRISYRRRNQEDRMVVPYSLSLLRAFNCHINVEVAGTSHLFQYLFKYIHKGADSARVMVSNDAAAPIDEIEEYWHARYLSAGEAAWRILGHHIARKEPSVTPLPVHLEASRSHHQYKRRTRTTELSDLDRYFHRPTGSFISNGVERAFANLTYSEYYALFRFEKLAIDRLHTPGIFVEHAINPPEQPRMVILRVRSEHLTRLTSVRPSQGELFYLRALLMNRAVASWEDARTIDGVLYDTYQEAANAAGLFSNDKEADQALLEAVETLRTPHELRRLFVHLLVNDCCPQPLATWETFKDHFMKDFLLRLNNHEGLALEQTLAEIGRQLDEHGRSLELYGLPQANLPDAEVVHELARWASSRAQLRDNAASARNRMTGEQATLFDDITAAIREERSSLKYVDGKAGRGKTFLIAALCDYCRANDWIALATATSAYAAQLYSAGRTTHSAFKVPVDLNNELLRSPIEPNSPRANLLRATRLIIIDEAPMANRAVLACIDDVLRRVMENNEPFGGKTVLLAGDFRQTCPVIRKGTKADIIDASIKSSPLWPLFDVQELTIPIRNAEDPDFAAWVDTIGDGAGPDVDISMLRTVSTVDELIDFVFPQEVIDDPTRCLKRSILCPTNAQIDAINDSLLHRVRGEEKTYYAADELKEASEAGLDADENILEFVAKQTPPGLPAFALRVKTNGVYRMMRNFSIDGGLVKNARVVIKSVGRRIVVVHILRTVNGQSVEDGEDILIPRITFDTVIPGTAYTLRRRQFPLAPAYGTTFNSCQGLTLDVAGMDATRNVFSHGQLYTAVSRVRNRWAIIARVLPGATTVHNVTYPEILL